MTETTTTYEVTELFFQRLFDEDDSYSDDIQLSKENNFTIVGTEALNDYLIELQIPDTNNAYRGQDAYYWDGEYVTIYRYVN